MILIPSQTRPTFEHIGHNHCGITKPPFQPRAPSDEFGRPDLDLWKPPNENRCRDICVRQARACCKEHCRPRAVTEVDENRAACLDRNQRPGSGMAISSIRDVIECLREVGSEIIDILQPHREAHQAIIDIHRPSPGFAKFCEYGLRNGYDERAGVAKMRR